MAADLSKVRAARAAGRPQRGQVQAKAQQVPPQPQLDPKKAFEAVLEEEAPLREPSNPFAKLLFDANLYLNGYLEALKASSSAAGAERAFSARGDAKGIGAA